VRQSAPASILDLFPTLLDHFGVAMPEGPARRGASLLPRLGMEKAAA
jgi:arylsulfatase A-like enzyme